jgi:endonuclease YncB( thermonuclease family)
MRRRRLPALRRGAEARAALFWLLAFGLASGGYAVLAPVVDDARSAARTMSRDCRVSGVVDGDTINLRCTGRGTLRARIVGYDSPELFSPGCAGERAAAERAKQVLATWVWYATSTEVAFLGRDRYGRVLVDLRLSGQRVATGMVETGNGRRYSGALRGGWC